MWRTARIAAAITLTAVGLSAAPAPDGRAPVTVYGDALTMELPEGWHEIDPQHLEEMSMWAADATAGRLVEVYQHGFLPPDFEADPWLPHLLVQIRESGRLSYGQFLDLQPLDDYRDDSHETFPRGLPPLIVGIEVERVAFDTRAFCIRLEHALNLRFKGPVRVLTAAFLTERGYVALHFVDRESRIDENRLLFDAIVESVSIGPPVAYRPRLTDRWPGLPFFAAAAVVAAALLAFLIHRRLRS